MHVKINKIHANNLIHIVFNTHMYIHMHYVIIVLTIWGKKIFNSSENSRKRM